MIDRYSEFFLYIIFFVGLTNNIRHTSCSPPTLIYSLIFNFNSMSTCDNKLINPMVQTEEEGLN